MALYRYRATTKEGKTREGEIVASNEREVIKYLSTKNLTPLSIKRIKVKRERIKVPFYQRISLLDKAEFAIRLSALLKAGVSVRRSLEMLEEGMEKAVMKKLCRDLRVGIERGRKLSEIIVERYAHAFPRYFIGLVEGGEESGNLDEVLSQVGVNFRKEHSLRKKIISAAFYPILLMIAGIFVITFMIIFVIPRLVKAYAQSGIKLPTTTLIIIKTSEFIKANYPFLILGTFLFFLLLYLIKRTKRGDLFFAKLSISLPVIGPLFKKIALSRFCRVLSMLLKSGMRIGQSLEISKEAIGNSLYKEALISTKELVIKGISLSFALSEHPYCFPPMVLGTIKVGEETGKLAEMLETLGDFYEREADRRAETLSSTVEPLLLLAMGLLIGFIAFSIITPIYKFITSF